MQNKIYIQQILGQFADDWVFAAYLGAMHLGYDVIFFEDIHEVPKNEFVVAFVEDTQQYFMRCGIDVPQPLNIPSELIPFTNRKIGSDLLNTIISNPRKFDFPLFIKPLNSAKAFSSGVIKKDVSTKELEIIFSDVVDKNQMAQISTVVDMKTEYRCFVRNGKVVGIKHYQGDFSLMVSIDAINKMIAAYKSAPIAYTLDVALCGNETILVECNDAWSIANYGLDGETYLKILLDRWKQIINNKK